MDSFECECPQLVELLNEKDENYINDGADQFFDALPKTKPATDQMQTNIFENAILPSTSSNVLLSITNNGVKEERIVLKAKRRSLRNNRNVIEKQNTFEGIALIPEPLEKQHTMTTRNDGFNTPKIDLRSRAIQKVQLKCAAKRKGSPLRSINKKYSSLAEKVYHFENDTPPRFRTVPGSVKKIGVEKIEKYQFKAKPVPHFLNKRSSTMSSLSSIRRVTTSRDQNTTIPFKAKEPVVLRKEPFVPKPSEKQLTDFMDVQLHTEKRAGERNLFQEHLKEVNLRNDAAKKEYDHVREKMEQEEIRQLRKRLVHKAKPAPSSSMPTK